MMKLSVMDCIVLFIQTSQLVFRKVDGRRGFLKRVCQLYRNGAQYESGALCSPLHEILGEMKMRGMGSSTNPEIVRVAITTTDLSARLRLFRSYAGVGIS